MKTTRSILAAGLLWLAAAAPALAQSFPNWPYGYVPTPAQWNAAFASKQDVLSQPACLVSGCTFNGEIIVTPSTTGAAGISISPGVAPSAPNNGDVWITGSSIFARVGGVTYDLIGAPCTNCALTNFANVFTQPQTIPGGTLSGTFAGVPVFSGANFLTLANLAQNPTAWSLLGNPTSGPANNTPFTIGGLTNKVSPATTDLLLIQDQAAGGALKYCTIAQCIASITAGVSTYNTRAGAVVSAFGDYPITKGGTGVDNCYNEQIGGLLPGKFTSAVIVWNAGFWCDQFGVKRYSTTDNTTSSTPNYNTPTTDYTTATVNWTNSPQPIGGMLSGSDGSNASLGLQLATSANNGTEVFNYAIHRISDNRVAIIGSSSDFYSVNGYSTTFTAAGGSSPVITLGVVPALRNQATVTFTTTGTLPSPLGPALRYFVCNSPPPYTNQIRVATTIGNAHSSTCLPLTTTGTGTHTMHWGVQNDIDFALGAGVAIVDRPIYMFNFVWNSGWDYIPDFQLGQYSSSWTATLFDVNNSAFCYNSLATTGSYTSLSFAFALPNINRRAIFYASCHGGASGGAGFMNSTGGAGNLPVCQAAAGQQTYNSNVILGTDSDTKIGYSMNGTVTMDICWRGQEDMDPR